MDDGNTTGGQPGGVPKVNLSKDVSTAHPATEPQGSPVEPPPTPVAPSGPRVPPSTPPPQGVGVDGAAPPSGRRAGVPRRALLLALVGVAAVAGIVWSAVGRGGPDEDGGDTLGGNTTTHVDAPTSSVQVETSDDDTEEVQTTPPTGAPPEIVAAPGPLRPTEVLASGGLPAATLRCTGETIDYGPERLIDGDVQTGWGVAGDGTGRSVSMRFAGSVELTQVGMIPGYAKVGPRADFDCQDVGAFDLNRVVVRASYRFDDGSEVVQTFEQRPELQFVAVDVVTTSVTITLIETLLPSGADDDTVISEVAFEGSAG